MTSGIISFIRRAVGAPRPPEPPSPAPIEDRAEAAARFLAREGWAEAARAPLAGDASSRSYERLAHPRLGRALLMDAPPEEGVGPARFAAATGSLRARGLSAPEIYAADFERGFVILEDLGDDLFARVVAADPGAEIPLYRAAAETLAALHDEPAPERLSGAGVEEALAPYDRAALLAESRLLLDWALPALTGAAPSAEAEESFLEACGALVAGVEAARAAFVLRDYHAENLIWLPERAGVARVGLLDYQDALAGHAAYDLVSLVEDARRDVSPEAAEAALSTYAAASGADADAVRAACALLGAQRNAKIVGIFVRLALRDRKPRYLRLVPRVWAHLLNDLAHPDAAPLERWIEAWLPTPTDARLRAVAAAIEARPATTGRPPAEIDTAMVLAAGLGARMRPLTDHRPKPLLDCSGRTLLDRTLDRAAEVGARRAVVNAHYLAEQIEAHLETRADLELQLSLEDKLLLETGGGVRAALRALDREAFLVVNSDNVWTGRAALAPLLAAWDPAAMDALLLLVPIERAAGYSRAGDFFLGPGGRLLRRGGAGRAPMVYTGAQIVARRAFDGAPTGAFSMNVVWDRLIAEGRAYGVAHRAGWADVGTPDGLAAATRLLDGWERRGDQGRSR